MSNQYPPPGGYPPSGGGYPPSGGKTKVLSLDNNIGGLLCYIPVCCVSLIFSILFLVTEPKENKFLRFHALQSLLLTGVSVVVYGILWVLGMILVVGSSATGSAAGSAAASGVSLLLLLVEIVLGVAFLIAFIMGCIKAYQNEMWKMPMIGNIADKNS
jgi:uncharacterized membrane protein